ncbi:uncharacterized protein [Nicotiana tomentosiformis]|uniref:uncharacterized protein n=1 Tax=Nicotiana tomentosiformis TaxID=4098 RepID=UPI00388CA413
MDEYSDEKMAVIQVNAKARNLLYNAIGGEEYEKISSCDTAKEMWDKLKVTYEGTSKMKESESIEEMFASFSKTIGDLKAFGRPYSSGRKRIGNLNLKFVKSKEMYFKKKFKNCNCNSMAYANPPVTALSGRIKRITNQLEKEPVEKGSTNFITQIFQDRSRSPKTVSILLELTKKDPRNLGYLKEGNNFILQKRHRKSQKGKWYLDSACFSHITGDKNLFKEVTQINGENVKFGDDTKGKIIGTGTVQFINNCDIIEIYLMDGLNYNLLSISQLCDSGYEVKFKKTGCTIEDETDKALKNFEISAKALREKKEESVHVILYDNNSMVVKGIIVGDEDINQDESKTNESQKLKKSTNNNNEPPKSTNEPISNHVEPQKELIA